MSTSSQNTAPDFGEPWHHQSLPHPISKDKGVYWLNPSQFNRACDCVNDCQGMPDPAVKIQAMRAVIVEAHEALNLCAGVIGPPLDAEWKSVAECDAAFLAAQSALAKLKPFLP